MFRPLGSPLCTSSCVLPVVTAPRPRDQGLRPLLGRLSHIRNNSFTSRIYHKQDNGSAFIFYGSGTCSFSPFGSGSSVKNNFTKRFLQFKKHFLKDCSKVRNYVGILCKFTLKIWLKLQLLPSFLIFMVNLKKISSRIRFLNEDPDPEGEWGDPDPQPCS